MSVPEPRLRWWRRRRTRWAIRVALVLAVLLIAREVVVTVLWRRYGAEQDRVGEELKRRDGRRVPLAGPAQTGNAWDDYFAAGAMVHEETPSHRELLQCAFTPRARTGDDVKAAADVHEAEAAILLVERGARREAYRPPVDLPHDEKGIDTGLEGFHHLSNLLGTRARMRLAKGDVEGAISSCVTGFQFGLDVAHGPRYLDWSFGASMVDSQLVSIQCLVRAPGLDADQIQRLEALLLAVELQFPGPFAEPEVHERERWLWSRTKVEELDFPRGVFRPETWQRNQVPWLALWKFGFSYRLASLDAMRFRTEFEAAAAPSEALPWSEAGPMMARLSQASRECANPLLSGFGVRLYWDEIYRTLTAELRLLRAALQLRRNASPGTPGWPDDPFTLAPLRLREMDGLRVLWSEGPDGNQEGVGEWRHRNKPEDIIFVVEEGP